jgi:hypothetical protein
MDVLKMPWLGHPFLRSLPHHPHTPHLARVSTVDAVNVRPDGDVSAAHEGTHVMPIGIYNYGVSVPVHAIDDGRAIEIQAKQIIITASTVKLSC